MKKIALALGLLATAVFAHAADPLNGTVWKTIDDKTKQPLSVVQFTETSNGVLSAKIVDVFTPGEAQKCSKCVGKYQNKPLLGAQIVHGLKNTGKNTYDGGKITDPKNGKTYSFNAKMSNDGRTLNGRGYIGVSALGRSQTWIRVN